MLLWSVQKFIKGQAGAEGAPLALMVLDTVLRHGVSSECRNQGGLPLSDCAFDNQPCKTLQATAC